MSVIGTFTPAKDGGWNGSIHTLTLIRRYVLFQTTIAKMKMHRHSASLPAGPNWAPRGSNERTARTPNSISASSSTTRACQTRFQPHYSRRRTARRPNWCGAGDHSNRLRVIRINSDTV